MKPSDSVFQRALDAPPSEARLFFLYGADESASRSQADKLIRSLGPDAERISVNGAQLRDDPGLLDGSARTQSLFGGKSAVLLQVDEVDPVMKAIERLVATSDDINLVVAVAGPLPNSHKLVKYAVQHPAIWTHVNYPLDVRGGIQVADLACRGHGLRAAPGVAQRLIEAANSDRDILAREVDKLALYLDAAPERPRDLSHDDLDAVLAGLSPEETGGLVDAVIGGRPSRAADWISELDGSGVDPFVWVRALSRRVQLLQQLHEAVNSGKSLDLAMKSARVFFKEEAKIQKQFRLWPHKRLDILSSRLVEAERQTKSSRTTASLEIRALLLQISRSAERAAA